MSDQCMMLILRAFLLFFGCDMNVTMIISLSIRQKLLHSSFKMISCILKFWSQLLHHAMCLSISLTKCICLGNMHRKLYASFPF
uniref:Uncharacterized protein n=1 Tax=Rhizophora mucronata TaxID=61149 RepID=A0A2P2PCI4_RHIMU